MTNILQWISDSDLEEAVSQFVKRANNAKRCASQRMKKNVVDPFSSLIVASTLNMDSKEALINAQQNASALSGIYNALGNFHQQVLGSVIGWTNHDAGYDLENTEQKILAEIKNKHNTMNSSTRKEVESKLRGAIEAKGRGWVAYLVIIIPKKPDRHRERLFVKQHVYEVDGASFYKMVTGEANALHDMFLATINILNSNGLKIPRDVLTYCQETYDRYMPGYEPPTL